MCSWGHSISVLNAVGPRKGGAVGKWEPVRHVEFRPHTRPPKSVFGVGLGNLLVLEAPAEVAFTEHEPQVTYHKPKAVPSSD